MLRNLVLSVLLIGVVVFGWIFIFGERSESGGNVENKIDTGSTSTEEIVPLGEGQKVEEVSRNENRYEHKILGFSFQYQKGYTISSFGNYFDSVGETILFQNNTGGGLQILITPFDESISLTVARIKKDLPSLNITEAKEQSIGTGENKVQIVTFKSTNNLTTGSSVEGWFVHRNQLYQVSASATSKDLFDKIINTWEIEN